MDWQEQEGEDHLRFQPYMGSVSLFPSLRGSSADPPFRSTANHKSIINTVGCTPVDYPYYDSKTISLNLSAFLDFLRSAPAQSVFLLHACAHNPTGVDPTREQWKEIAEIFLSKGHYAFFDCAYQVSRSAFDQRAPN